jgi:UDP-N-acetylmuramoylalanine--D-glutamate ligase
MTLDDSAVRAWLLHADRTMDWSGVHASVFGLGRAGFAAADALLRVGAKVSVFDQRSGKSHEEHREVLTTLGARVLLDADQPTDVGNLVIPSPGLPPTHSWLRAAADVTIWSGETLAWQLRPMEPEVPWLVLTGTNGKTTTVEMLAAILRADGLHTQAVGNVGRPLVEAIFAEPAYDVFPVELSSFQLHWTTLLRPHAAAILNIAEDHIDWHGDHASYVADKARIYRDTAAAVIYNVEDPVTDRLAHEAEVAEGCRGIGFTLGIPSIGMVGVVDGVIADRAFVDNRRTHAAELVSVAALRVKGQHNVANAVAATTLARSLGVSPGAVRRGLTGFETEGHRLEFVATVGGVDYVDDSKATNPHAADVALAEYESVVWVAGGLAKGASFDDLIRRHRSRIVAAVLMGADRGQIADAMRRHAPKIPVIEVPDSETDPMETAVRNAAAVAPQGGTVLLAPACASMDHFPDYAARGSAFQAAVRRLAE